MVDKLSPVLSLSFSLFLISASSSDPDSTETLIQCLSNEFPSNISILNTLYFPRDSSNYEPILESRIENLKFFNHSSKPLAIITPNSYSQVQITIKCCKQNGVRVRIRSGGHDYEGTSYTSSFGPFVMVDLRALRSINIDVGDETAWVESGATIGELYYAISQKSSVHGFPAGLYSTVGIGGHFGGGGVGNLIRKYGLAADNVIDAKIIDAKGELMDRKSMGNGLFWAIRGGGGASFGAIVAWKIRLVRVSSVVTDFEVSRSLEQGAISLIHKWQDIAHKAHRDLLISVVLSAGSGTPALITFRYVFLGKTEDLLHILGTIFPNLGVNKQDCKEMSWIESIVRFSSYQRGVTTDALKNNVAPLPDSYYKGKIDLVYKPIPIEALGELLKRLSMATVNTPPIINFELHPYGGRMDQILESDTLFPHRKGVLYEIVYIVGWVEDRNGEIGETHMNWLRRLSEFMTPFVSKEPRRTVLNARDFDLGINDNDVCGDAY